MKMAKAFAKQFYSSKAWQDCRNEYAKSKHYLCEPCLRRGLYVTGEIVHHKIELTPETINVPEIALGWWNLELVCRECHAAIHKAKRNGQRYIIGPDGDVTPEEI